MIKEIKYIKLQEVLSRVLRHPLLQDVNLEAAIQYTVDFIGIFGLPDMYEDKEAVIEIHKHRGELPCDLISITQVVDGCHHIGMRSMTDTFNPDNRHWGRHSIGYIGYNDEMTFKTQNRIIFTSFDEGTVKISYKAIPVDEDGFPMIIDNPVYLKALEMYIKKEAFTILYECGKIQAPILQNVQQEYAFRAGQLNSEFSIPSLSEMESISRSWSTLLQRTTDFDKHFRDLGDREYIRQQ